ncbi:MAG: hypothetical protein E7413_05030 [Ruminococcaceae bacterium]|nr:hypothetical protein [Oscillospiraceae bacterium]
MKSNICKLNEDLTCLEAVLAEVEKVTKYNALEGKKALRLRLLTEELCGMLPGLTQNFDGEFWTENDGNHYELHVKLQAEDMNLALREELLAVSKSKKNAAAKGVMGKIRAVAETMLLAASDPALQALPVGDLYDYHGYNMGFGYIDPTIAYETDFAYSWSLFAYKKAVEEKAEDAFAELERSIVAKLADDIIVGVRGKNVEIIVTWNV